MRFVMHKFNKDDPFFNMEKQNLFNKKEDEKNKESNRKINIQISNEDLVNNINFTPSNNSVTNPTSDYKNLDYIGNEIFLNEGQKNNLRKILYSNYKKLGRYANKFEDNFIKKLVEASINKNVDEDNEENIDKMNNIISKSEILNFIQTNQHDILFEIFYNYDVFECESHKKKEISIWRLVVSHLLSEMGNIWLEFFNPNYSITDPNKKDFVNQLKAINYLIYNIKKEDYPRAYSCFSNIHPENRLINKIKNNLEVMAKNQIFCDIVENHIDASQYYREQKKYETYRL